VTDRALSPASGRERLAGAAALAAIAAAIAVRDPHRPGALPLRCPTKLVTGLECPACGGMRLAHDLLHGDLRAAAHDNLFLLVAAPVLLALMADERRNGPWSQRRGRSRMTPYAVGAVAATWMVVRNLPRWPLKPITRPATA
jgi:hypothetical protein